MLNPFQLIEFNAKVYPAKIALDDGSASTYRQFYVLAKKVAAKLRKMGVKHGDLVVTALPSGVDWIFTHALFHEACITCSNHGYMAIDPALEVDWIISTQRLSHFPDEKQIVINQAWFEDLSAEAVADRMKEYADENALCRLVLTSGTTGHSKAVAFSVATLNSRLNSTSSYWSVARGELNLMALSTIGGFMTALSSTLTGDTYFAPDTSGYVDSIRKYGIRSLLGSPVQIAGLLKTVSLADQPLSSIKEIRLAGGALSPALITALRNHFDAEIYNVYGSTEVGGVTLFSVNKNYDSSIAGYLIGLVEVEIVDESGAVLPANVDGNIKIKTATMAQGYYKNIEETARSFRDGGFYPGDRGRLTEDGLLMLSGRSSEIINLGGVKIDPAAVDHILLNYPGIEDAAAFGLETETGVRELAAAIIASDNFELDRFRADMLKTLGAESTPKHFFNVKSIPRNAMGKVMRAQMSERLSRVFLERSVVGGLP
jgi:acyl-coenzyme A synthetase/AMP-(fatty) acid ligase